MTTSFKAASFAPFASMMLALAIVLSACQSSGDEATVTEVGSEQAYADAGESKTAEPEDMSDAEVEDDRKIDDGAENSSSQPGELAAAEDADVAGASLLAQAMTSSLDGSSFGFEGSLVLSGSEASDSAAITFGGAHDRAANATEFTVDLAGIGQLMSEGEADEDLEFFQLFFADPIQVIMIDDIAWVNWDLFSMFTPADQDQKDSWIEMAAEDGESMVGDLGVESGISDPTELLTALRNVAGDIEDLGSDEIRGVTATHYRMYVDSRELEEALPDDEAAELDAVEIMVPVDFWVDTEDRLRKVSMSLTDPEMLEDAEITGLTVDFELFDFGQPMGIEPPPADQILTEDDLGFSLAEDF